MIKIIFLVLGFIFTFAENITVFGLSSSLNNNIAEIKDGMLLKDGMIISANDIIYDQTKKIIIAKGNVYINYDKKDYILANKVIIDLNNNNIKALPFFLFNFDDNSWINSKEAYTKNSLYFGKESIASTCSVNNPDWKIVSSSVNYNKQTKWIDLYNPTLYIKNIPVLYLPYLGFSLDKTRSSGFLKPLFGYSANEGFLFTLPYYQTLGRAADLEIDPTVRTKRGRGIYSTFRFVHSPTSYGEFRIGTFRDDLKYQKEYNLVNRNHTGWSFLYTNHSIFNKSDQFYVDLKNANDTDYFYLDAYNYTFRTINDKILTSNINYYVTKNYDYLGIYAKYFKDTSKVSNEDTMQILPQINYHRFYDNFWNNFSYSIDANVYNYTRQIGYTARKESLVLPVNYNTNFFKDYLKLGITEQFSIDQVDTSDGNISKLLRLDTFIKLYSNLSKKYETFIHNISPSITFGMDNYYNYNGVESDYINTSLIKKSIAFNLTQYLISDNWEVDHKLSEVYYLKTDENNRYSDLLNEITVKYNNYYLEDNNKFSLNSNVIKYNSITLGFNDGIKKLEANYIFQRKTDNIDESKSYDVNGYWKYDGIHKLFAEYNYDLVLDIPKYQIFGISMQKKCWNYSISYKKETLPLLTNDGISSIIQKTIYFEIELVPLGGIKQQYQLNSQKGY